MHASSVQEVLHPQSEEMRRNLYLHSCSALKYSIKRDFFNLIEIIFLKILKKNT